MAMAVVLAACSGGRHAADVTTTTAAPATTTAAPTTTTIAVAAPTTTVPASAPNALQAAVDRFAVGQRVPFSVVALDLSTGVRGEHLAGRQVLSASLYKLFVAREELRRIYAGSLSRQAPANDGGGRTIDQCLHDMIVVSDDRCGVAGLALIGRGAQDATLASLGYASTRLATPQRTSAADVALFLSRTRDGTLLGPRGEAATGELYGLLKQQRVNDRLPAGLPPGTPIAHKTGDRTGWAHDAGIITTPRGDLLLVVLSGPWPSPCCHEETIGPLEREAFHAIGTMGGLAYQAVSA